MRKPLKYFFVVGSFLSLTPIFWLIFKLRNESNPPVGMLMIKLFFLLLGFVVVWLVIKIIRKLIHTEEQETQIDTVYLTQLSALNANDLKHVLWAFSLLLAILFVSLIPAPWNILLILFGFYLIFTYISQ